MKFRTNAVCAYCGIKFYRVQYRLDRYKREGKPIHCSKSCGVRAHNKKKKEAEQDG